METETYYITGTICLIFLIVMIFTYCYCRKNNNIGNHLFSEEKVDYTPSDPSHEFF